MPHVSHDEAVDRGHFDPNWSPRQRDSMWAQGAQRRERILDSVRSGMPVQTAVKAEGITWDTYKKYRQRYQDWKMLIEEALDRDLDSMEYKGDFVTFRGRYLNRPTPVHQRSAVEHMSKPRPGQIVLMLWHPEAGKTTTIEDACTYWLATEPETRISVAHAKEEHAQKILRTVRGYLSSDGPFPDLVHRFGPFEPQVGTKKARRQPWSAGRFDVFKKSGVQRDYSMVALGLGSHVQGLRTDKMILDDLISRKNWMQSARILEDLRQDWFSRPGQFGTIYVLGTRVEENDLYEMLETEGLVDEVIRFPAYDVAESPVWPWQPVAHKRDVPEPPPGVKFLWPQRYTPHQYAQMRFTVGEAAWWRNWMQRPSAAAARTFTDELIAKGRDEHRSVLSDPPHLEGTQTNLILSLDPALGGGNALGVGAMLPDELQLLDARVDYGLTRWETVFELAEIYLERYTGDGIAVTEFVIEDKAYQKGLLSDDRILALQARYGFSIVANTTGGEKSDENIGVPAMTFSLRRGEITWPWSDPVSTEAFTFLEHELAAWRPKVPGNKLRQDGVMMLWFMWRRWQVNRSVAYAVSSDVGQRFSSRPSPLAAIRFAPAAPRLLIGGRR